MNAGITTAPHFPEFSKDLPANNGHQYALQHRYSPGDIRILHRLGKNTDNIPHYLRAFISVFCDRIPHAAPVPTNSNLKNIPVP
uniref:Uncharacterized protein n=1 Tax=Echinococcus granulosus TaxID=6210 RepID=A0A068WM55_ECHGR|nr:hypothetical protein EgrG_000654900 [Echinococcus granulosus]